MSFENDYKELLKFASNILREKGIYHSESAELVNEAYIKWFDESNNTPYDIKAIKGLIRTCGWSQKAIESQNQDNTFLKEYPCKRCKESLPASAFYIQHDLKNNIKSVSTYCLKCRIELRIIWQKENKEMWNAYMIEWRKNHNGTLTRKEWLEKKAQERGEDHLQKLWNRANKKYQSKQREQLTDAYIRTILTNKNMRRCDITREMIEMKRTELIEKRNSIPINSHVEGNQ